MKYEFHLAALQKYAEAVEFFSPARQTTEFYRHHRECHISDYWGTRALADRWRPDSSLFDSLARPTQRFF
jgi:hypothetical protein